MLRSFKISVPASSANIGPGYDVLGIGLSLYLELNVVIDPHSYNKESGDQLNCQLSYTHDSEGVSSVSLKPDENLITRTSLYLLHCKKIYSFPSGTQITIHNPIPLGRGLGSSGAAIVAGVLLGNEIGQLGLSKQQMLDYCLMIERHPDNLTASMMGGFVGSFLREMTPSELKIREVPLCDVLPNSSNIKSKSFVPPLPPKDISRYIKYNWNQNIKCIVVIPNFELSTIESREVLPVSYSTKDVVFNLQRLAILTTALTEIPPNPELIHASMQDKLHQQYRAELIPGLTDILANINPYNNPGLLGICLSGAGPTVLALADSNFEAIAKEIMSKFSKENVVSGWKLLDISTNGAFVQHM